MCVHFQANRRTGVDVDRFDYLLHDFFCVPFFVPFSSLFSPYLPFCLINQSRYSLFNCLYLHKKLTLNPKP